MLIFQITIQNLTSQPAIGTNPQLAQIYDGVFKYFQDINYQALLVDIKTIFIILSVIFGTLFVIVVRKIWSLGTLKQEFNKLGGEFNPPPEAPTAYNARWDEIRRHVNSFVEAEWKLAVIEGDKFVDDVLKTAGFAGESMGERLMLIKPDQIINLQYLWDAHKLRNLLVHYILLSFIFGVFVGSFFNISKNTVLIGAMICASLIAIFYRRGSRLLNIKFALAAFLALFFLAGVLRYNTVYSKTHHLQRFAEAQQNVVDPQNKHPIKVTLLGYIAGEPEINGSKQRFAFYAKQLNAPPYIIETDERVLVTTALYPRYQYGDIIKVYGNIRLPENFDDFDYKSYLAKDSVFTVVGYPEINRLEAEPSNGLNVGFLEKGKITVFRKIFAFKNALENSIARSVAEPNASFISGILLGSRLQISQDIKDAFTRTSMTHVLAISGYNITIIAWLISAFFLLFLRRQTAFWFSLLGVALFTILTGAQASVIRAAIMGILVLLAHREGRLNEPRNAIIFAGAIMIFVSPMILRHDIGFQLSFMATLGLIYLAPLMEKYFTKLPQFFKLRETFTMTISAQIFVLPLLLYYFKSFSLTSLPANIIVLPTIPFAMLLGFISGIIGMFVPFLGQLTGYFAWILTAAQLEIIKWFAAPSWAAVAVNFNWPMLIAAYCLLIWFLRVLSKKVKQVPSKE
ncbi:MAG: ComEC family competence protein [Candidatus Yanofskybacteria bacterium]|nr:ComEC family competence protein [Candidatus Yanofskybacteria bacterium]